MEITEAAEAGIDVAVRSKQRRTLPLDSRVKFVGKAVGQRVRGGDNGILSFKLPKSSA